MPYSTNAELPDSIKSSIQSEAGRDIMREVINRQLGAGKSETVAFASAWAALQRAGYSQNDEGEWVDKTLTLGDVHVPTTEERGVLRKFAEWIMKSDPDTPAPEKDRITGSGRNKPGSASGERGGIDFNEKTLAALQEKADNSKYTLGQLKAVYRRGAGAYSTSHRPGVSRAAWAMARVNSFISGGHSQDNDLKKQGWVEKSDFDDVDLYDQVDLDDYISKAGDIEKAEYQGKQVELNKPFRTPGESKKFAVYVRSDEDNVVIVRFGDPEMSIRRDDPEARANFRARHNCDAKKDKTTAGYWSCVMWGSSSVSDILGKAGRYLDKLDAKRSMMPLKYDINALSLLRPDQVPRMLGSITHPERLGIKNKAFMDLIAIQNRVDTSKVKEISEQEYDGAPCGVVARFNNENYIIDGHHRIVGRWLAGDERVDVYFIDLEPKSNAMKCDTDFNFTADILKSDEDQRLVYGWASIIYENGEPVTDSQGDIIAEDDLLEAAHNYVSQYREAKAMHEGSQIGEVVESLVFTADVQKALGIDLGKIGWFIGMKISDDAVWAKFRDGSLSEFSVGGRGRRIEIDD